MIDALDGWSSFEFNKVFRSSKRSDQITDEGKVVDDVIIHMACHANMTLFMPRHPIQHRRMACHAT
jgi:hypothetical protein